VANLFALENDGAVITLGYLRRNAAKEQPALGC
jgi:hypothetical protein